ncbi:MAG: hypothetical protein FJW14_19380 [Acidimicrobiia bacterium]|nr:hypothetical protein [Acidimicrobiia bacterium]
MTFRVYQRGALVGTTTVVITRESDGWRLQGDGELKGDFQLTMPQLDIRYDEAWSPRIMTMELVAKDDRAVVHVAFGLSDGTTRTDVVRPDNATWGSNKVSADAIPLPDLVFGAYEALAARLASATPGQELRAFIAPRFEAVMSADGVVDEDVPTTAGTLATKRWRVTLRRPEGPSPMEIWVAGGRMVRLDVPREGLSVVRQDVIWGRGQVQ